MPFTRTLAFMAAGLMLSVSLAVADEQKPDMKAMIEKMEKADQPGEQHKQMAKMEGKWDTKTKSWMEPNTPPVETTGSCEYKMLMDGRYLKQKCAGDPYGHPIDVCSGRSAC